MDEPRLTAWYADPGVRYGYSGQALEPAAWPASLDTLRRELRARLGCDFNAVLCNAYRDGQDAMGWHADDEPELGPEPVIASLSLGATRRFRIRPRRGGESVGLELESGSLLLMDGRSQADYCHALVRTRRPVRPRINLTFRQVMVRSATQAEALRRPLARPMA